MTKKYRINGFEQIKAFYSWVFDHTDNGMNPTHISLYLFLINQANRNGWPEWFKCPYDLGMAGSKIGSRNTYYKCLADLKEWGLIDYEKGINYFKAPVIKIYPLKNEHVRIPKSEQVSEPVSKPLSEPLPEHIYKLVTSNLKPITIHFNEFEKFVKGLSGTKKPKDYGFIDQIIEQFVQAHGNYEVTARGKERAAAGKLLQKYKEKYPAATSEETLIGLRHFFNQCVNINDAWLRTNMSLPIIMDKFNQIKIILNNGGLKKDNGATAEQILGSVHKYFPIEGYPGQ